jgi:hypothetical protein
MLRTFLLGLVLATIPALAAPQDDSAEDAAAAEEVEDKDAATLLVEARELYSSLEYDRVIPIVERVLADPSINIDQRLDAYLLQGSCLAIVGNTVDAEKPFRFLLRGRPDYDMGPETPPRILQVFRKVQVEERSIRDQMQELERKKMIESMALEAPEIKTQRGGLPVVFDYLIKDPRGAAARVSVLYRKGGAPAYSSLALSRQPDGRWRGEIPGEWTANDEGFRLEYMVKTLDDNGAPLLQAGSEAAPLVADVEPGQVGEGGPFYSSVWFWSATGVAVLAVAGSAATVTYFASQPPAADLVIPID